MWLSACGRSEAELERGSANSSLSIMREKAAIEQQTLSSFRCSLAHHRGRQPHGHRGGRGGEQVRARASFQGFEQPEEARRLADVAELNAEGLNLNEQVLHVNDLVSN